MAGRTGTQRPPDSDRAIVVHVVACCHDFPDLYPHHRRPHRAARPQGAAVIIDNATIIDGDRWLDAAVAAAYQDQPLAQDWARLAKVAEELGEAIAEMISFTGQNPRKPQDPAARWRLLAELADVCVTAILCTQHLTKDITATAASITAGATKLRDRTPAQYRTDAAAAAVPNVDQATDQLVAAVARWNSAVDGEPHAHSDAEIEYAHELMKLAARALTRATDAEHPDRQPVGWQ